MPFGDLLSAIDPSSPANRNKKFRVWGGKEPVSLNPPMAANGTREGYGAGAQQPPAVGLASPVNATPTPPPPAPGLFQGMGAGAAQATGQPALGPQRPAPQLNQADAYAAYMKTGRNPNLGPSAPYGIFTPGGISDQMSGGMATRAMNPPQSGPGSLQQGIRDLQGIQGSITQGPMSPPPSNQSYGGAFGQPTRNITDLELARAGQIGAQGSGRESMLADMNGRPRGGYTPPVAGPELDLSQKPQFSFEQYRRDPTGSVVPSSNGDVQLRTAAAEKFNARPERQQYLDGRKAVMAGRNDKRFAREEVKGLQRSERIANRKYVPSFEDKLAAMNPGAYQGRRAMEARMNGESLIQDKRLGLAEKQMASNERIAGERTKALVGAKNIENGLGPDGKPIKPEASAAAAALSRATPEAQIAHIEKTDPEAAAAIQALGDQERRRVLRRFFPIMSLFGG